MRKPIMIDENAGLADCELVIAADGRVLDRNGLRLAVPHHLKAAEVRGYAMAMLEGRLR